MNTLEINSNTLAMLYEKCPQSFEGITLEDKMLKYDGVEVDISTFNINDLLSDSNSHFAASLDTLAPEDVFKIIRLHATLLGGSKSITRGPEKDEDESKKRIEIIQQENPLMRNISVVKKNDDGIKREYINIVASDGKDHLFPNDRNVNIFDVYELLKLQNGGTVTPDELIAAVYRKLYDVRLDTAENLIDKETTSEDFANKLERVNEPYKNSKTTDVVASEEHDIAIISDKTDPGNHKVVTFDQNEFGDLVVNEHGQNVAGTDTISRSSADSTVVGSSAQVDETINSNNEIFEKDEEKIEALLIPTQEFYDLLNSPKSLSEDELASVNLYYGYLGDLIIYEDYLVAELRKMLQDFKDYVYELEYGDVHVPLNEKQRGAIAKLEEMKKVDELSQGNLEPDKIDDSVKKLQRIRPVDNYHRNDEDNAGMISTVQVVAFIIGIAIILTAVTLYLLS